ncbi:tetratricopeptide repeat protein [Mycobacterium sp. URHB0044]|uniref:tetratricopeptide repeat protein n=1 Tax=Mycobacterium sp. URHB0044 TaxID=1380386 RepID=UPI000B285127|nr:tetratricopeptide repeat protein [Mycobacterium sp. URHB0044]
MTAPFSDADSVLNVVDAYLSTGHYRRAEDTLRAALATDPQHPRLLTAYARAKLGQSDYASGAISAHAALAVAPENEYAMRVYTRALELQGRIPEALWMAWRTATTHPLSDLAHHNYARLLEEAGHPAEAMTAINDALRLNPFDVDALNLRGDIYVDLGQIDPAEADYRQALQLNPEDATAVHNLARLKYARGRRWGAIYGFLGAGRLDPAYGDVVRQNVGVVLTGVLRRSIWLVLIVAIAVIATYNLHEGGNATVIPRIVAGVGAVLLLVTHTRVMHRLPRRTLKSVLRQRQFLAVRILQLFAAAVIGAETAMLGAMTLPAVLASLLVLSLPVVVVVGGLTDERLW